MTTRRRSPRSKHDSVLDLVDGAGRKIPVTARLADVSDHGIAFTTTQELEPGQQLRGTLRTLPRGARAFTGKVVRKVRKGNATLYGLEFDGHVTMPPLDLRLGGTD